jgi:hypothetical protein
MISINAVAFQEGDIWIVQGIEFDICTRASSPADVPAAFARAVVENAVINRHLGRSGLSGIKPAPSRFKEMFDNARAQVKPVEDLPLGDLAASEVNIRLAQNA